MWKTQRFSNKTGEGNLTFTCFYFLVTVFYLNVSFIEHL